MYFCQYVFIPEVVKGLKIDGVLWVVWKFAEGKWGAGFSRMGDTALLAYFQAKCDETVERGRQF